MQKRKKLLLIMAILSLAAAVLILLAISLVVRYEARGIIDMPAVGIYRFKFKIPAGIFVAIAVICHYMYVACFSRNGKKRFERNEANTARDSFAAISCANIIVALTFTYLFETIALIMAVGLNTFIRVLFAFAVPFSCAAAAVMAVLTGITAYRIHKEFSPET